MYRTLKMSLFSLTAEIRIKVKCDTYSWTVAQVLFKLSLFAGHIEQPAAVQLHLQVCLGLVV